MRRGITKKSEKEFTYLFIDMFSYPELTRNKKKVKQNKTVFQSVNSNVKVMARGKKMCYQTQIVQQIYALGK